ncbi:MAG TPA: hybrid sensor histidine kinase/response regulator [Candidatus Limnocylindria bacterium]|nr:hybrid sensor histidine kinase/response regulator [Candidatus Limnocylindria bacterium]
MNPTSDHPAAEPPNPTAPARILIVDDQPANIQVMGSILGKLGYAIIPATDGPTAFKRLALRMPDLILLDLLMPEMDGCEVCRQLQANPLWKDIPVVFLSAADDKDLIVRALDSGGVDYITKPFNQAELISRVRTQIALKSARDSLKQLAEDKDELLGILAHDLKGHLGGLQMSAELLSERLLRGSGADPQSAQLADNIHRTSGQLLAFVREFLANSAAEHGLASTLETVDLAEAAMQAVEVFREAARRKGLKVSVSLSDPEVPVRADRTALNHVLENLISNALKFSPPQKEIRVAVTHNAGFGECSIQDEGPGFTEADKLKMFRRYGRLSARPTGNEPSTGLGLSIVRKHVDMMDGELICDSSAGQGTTFRLRLPQPGTAPTPPSDSLSL